MSEALCTGFALVFVACVLDVLAIIVINTTNVPCSARAWLARAGMITAAI
jgi:hypothetical protein